ncbi:magnesium-transporting ATPase (P-type) [Neobacillus niacini]|uniref:hypothetical protein n=1 Tax=Neobacillus driksii TaxID=3035913 RepID=UPI0027857EF2|nr:hypothetical protein [Neobacillus niacini]MDQ0975890.1 magnesium-transporting ATPase (P-type) [Neobacillus niacini]
MSIMEIFIIITVPICVLISFGLILYAIQIAIKGFRLKDEQQYINAAIVSLTSAIIPLGLYFTIKIFNLFLN